jgi:hypothetical protein
VSLAKKKRSDWAYLTGKDYDLINGSGSLFLQELTDDIHAKVTGTNNSKVLVSRHRVERYALVGVESATAMAFSARNARRCPDCGGGILPR